VTPEVAVQIEFDRKKLLTAAVKGGISGASGNIPGVLSSIVDVVAAFSRKAEEPPDAQEGAQLLLHRAMYRLMVETFRTFRHTVPGLLAEADPKEIEAALSGLTAVQSLDLDEAAFPHPSEWPGLDGARDLLDRWLGIYKLSAEEKAPILRWFTENTAIYLDIELLLNEKDYAALETEISRRTVMDEPARQARNWQRYRVGLIAQVLEPLFRLDETLPQVSLNDMYFRARAVLGADKAASPDGPSRQVAKEKPRLVWVDDTLRQWLDSEDRDGWIRVLVGGPGIGKSSFARIFAADLARQNRRVLLVPLNRINYNQSAYSAISEYLMSPDVLNHNPLESLRQ
jgi:hypothetical protein